MDLRILVASDATSSADGALQMALALSRGGRGSVEVLSVVPPVLAAKVPTFGALPRDLSLAERCEHSRRSIERQLAALGEATAWPIAVELGSPSQTIARVAKDMRASLILVGVRQRERDGRLVHSGTALGVTQWSSLPVMAIPAARTEARLALPRRVLVALDLDDPNLDTLHGVLPLLSEDAEIHLAHVAWEAVANLGEESSRADSRSPNLHNISRIEKNVGQLRGIAGMRVRTHVLRGNPATELLELGDHLGADLIASGSQGYGFLSRALMRNVSTQLVRGANCAVLIRPTGLREEVDPVALRRAPVARAVPTFQRQTLTALRN